MGKNGESRRSRDFLLLCLVGMFLAAVSPREAGANACGKKEEVLQALKDKYGEVPVWVGEAKAPVKGVLMMTEGESGSWTLLRVVPASPGLMVCLLMEGERGALSGAEGPAPTGEKL